MLAESVGLALLVVLEKLEQAERLSFVLHDVFAMTFEEIRRSWIARSSATRQLASRARRRVQGQAPIQTPRAAADATARRRRVSLRGRPGRRLRSAGDRLGSGDRPAGRRRS